MTDKKHELLDMTDLTIEKDEVLMLLAFSESMMQSCHCDHEMDGWIELQKMIHRFLGIFVTSWEDEEMIEYEEFSFYEALESAEAELPGAKDEVEKLLQKCKAIRETEGE